MIVEKKNKKVEGAQQTQPTTKERERTPIEVAVESNPMTDAYHAVKKILLSIKEDPSDPDSPPYFKTIKLDNGQLARIKGSKLNEEYGIAFPAVFIHYINIYNNVGTSSIAESKGTMRIHYVLNRLNNSDDDTETEGFDIYKKIVSAIERKKGNFPPLVSHFQLSYWDQPLSFDDGLQPYWIDYQIWFRDYSAYAYKDYTDVYLTEPPFTQPSDQNEIANPERIPNWQGPYFEDVARFEKFD